MTDAQSDDAYTPLTDPERVTLTERIKALLDEHLVGHRWWAAGSSQSHGYCSGCPWESESEDFRAEHRAHVAEVIAALSRPLDTEEGT